MTSGWTVLFFLAFLCSISVVEGKYRITWITNKATNSGTRHWITFKFIGSDGRKTAKLYSGETATRGRVRKEDVNVPSVGDIAKVIVGVEKWGINVFNNDWNGWKVIISDFETKKTYEFEPGWITTGKTKEFKPREITCKDVARDPAKYCKCGTVSDDDGAFNMARTDYSLCMKSCGMCVA